MSTLSVRRLGRVLSVACVVATALPSMALATGDPSVPDGDVEVEQVDPGLLELNGVTLAVDPASPAIPIEGPSRAAGAWTAQVQQPTSVRSRPGGGRVVWRAGAQAPTTGNAHVLMVLEGRFDARRRPWLRVRLPIRPNGTAGWIPADLVALERTPYYVTVSRSARTVDVYRSGRRVLRQRGVIGAPTTPTPTGLHALYETSRTVPGSRYGPWALHLTALSDVLFNYGGGPGRVALHGRSGELLKDPIGSAASLGCVRLPNGAIARLARLLPAGTPVEIRR